MAAYRTTHRDEISAQQAAYRAAHREEISAKNDAYRAVHAGEIVARQAAYRAANRDKTAAYLAAKAEEIGRTRAAYRASHREELATKQAAWVKANPEAHRAHEALRRARKLGNSIGFPLPDLEAILAEFGMVCHICGLEIESRADLHFDHVISLAKEGPHSAENIRPSHASCNKHKGTKRLEDYHRNPVPG